MSERILITGGCGFIGHHMVEHILKNTGWDIIIFDKLKSFVKISQIAVNEAGFFMKLMTMKI